MLSFLLVLSTAHMKSTQQLTTSLPDKTPVLTKAKTTTATITSVQLLTTSASVAKTSQEISATSTLQKPAASSSITEVIPTSREHGKRTTTSPTSEEPETEEPETEEPETGYYELLIRELLSFPLHSFLVKLVH